MNDDKTTHPAIAALAVLALIALSSASFGADLGFTATSFQQALNKSPYKQGKVRLETADQEEDAVWYTFGPCVSVSADIDAATKHLTAIYVAPTTDDNSGCTEDSRGLKIVVSLAMALIMSVVGKDHNVASNLEALTALMKKATKNTDVLGGMWSGTIEHGGRWVFGMVLLGGARVEYSISTEAPADPKHE